MILSHHSRIPNLPDNHDRSTLDPAIPESPMDLMNKIRNVYGPIPIVSDQYMNIFTSVTSVSTFDESH